MTRRPSVYDLLQAKGTTKWVQLHVDDAAEAAAAVEAGDWIAARLGEAGGRSRVWRA